MPVGVSAAVIEVSGPFQDELFTSPGEGHVEQIESFGTCVLIEFGFESFVGFGRGKGRRKSANLKLNNVLHSTISCISILLLTAELIRPAL